MLHNSDLCIVVVVCRMYDVVFKYSTHAVSRVVVVSVVISCHQLCGSMVYELRCVSCLRIPLPLV